MPKYAPHTLPTDGARLSAPQQESARQDRTAQSDTQPTKRPAQAQRMHPAILLGQHIRRERGMHGVRGYTSAVREYLSEPEYKELCASMGVPPDTRPPAQPHQQPQVMHTPPPVQPQQPPAANQAQLMQMLTQLMPLLSGGAGGGGAGNPLGQFMNNSQGGGFNPSMLSSLLGGQSNTAGAGGGLDPMMLAQLLGGLNK